jgi:hypothetical protein
MHQLATEGNLEKMTYRSYKSGRKICVFPQCRFRNPIFFPLFATNNISQTLANNMVMEYLINAQVDPLAGNERTSEDCCSVEVMRSFQDYSIIFYWKVSNREQKGFVQGIPSTMPLEKDRWLHDVLTASRVPSNMRVVGLRRIMLRRAVIEVKTISG